MRSLRLLVSGLLVLLALGLGAMPASAAGPSTGGCGVVAFDGENGDMTVPNASHAVAGAVNISLPCDGGLWLSFTTELLTASGGALVTLGHVVTCVAPAVPNGCTVSITPLPVVPDNDIGLHAGATGAGGNDRTTRTATAVLTGLLRGNYHVEWQVLNSSISGTVTAGKRLSSAQGFGTLPTLPTTPPGSSQ
jgi:hypothetical protein